MALKVLKAYLSEEDKMDKPWSYGSPLVRELEKRYDYTEVIFPPEMDEEEKAEIIREYDVLITMWGSPHVPNSLADNPGRLKHVCNITGEIKKWIDEPIAASPHIYLTNWGESAGWSMAEAAMTLLLAMLKNLRLYVGCSEDGKGEKPDLETQGSLYQRCVGIYGMGAIGRKFVEMLKPFGPIIYAFDPYVPQMPEGVIKVDTLEELFDKSQIVAIHAGLSEETRNSVTADLLARLPDNGIIINTARGAIIDSEALNKEILSGRLRAGIDVYEPNDYPEKGSPLFKAENAIWTAHHLGAGDWGVDPDRVDIYGKVCLDNLERLDRGEEPKYQITQTLYRRMT